MVKEDFLKFYIVVFLQIYSILVSCRKQLFIKVCSELLIQFLFQAEQFSQHWKINIFSDLMPCSFVDVWEKATACSFWVKV